MINEKHFERTGPRSYRVLINC